jgi:hypothetical protein
VSAEYEPVNGVYAFHCDLCDPRRRQPPLWAYSLPGGWEARNGQHVCHQCLRDAERKEEAALRVATSSKARRHSADTPKVTA